jgi:FkbM family methyltransferase
MGPIEGAMATDSVKQQLRRIVPLEHRYSFHRLKRVALEGLTMATRRVTDVLPLEVAVSIKEGVSRTSRLDYGRAPIRMEIATATQVARLSACRKEPETVRWIEQHIGPGDVFYDIGANVGAYAFIADAAAGGQARVYAFEPGAATYAALAQNVFLNSSSGRVIPLPLALAQRTALRSFHYSSLVPGAAFHVMPEESVWAGHPRVDLEQPVITFSIDDMIARLGIPEPTLVKIDVDGVELSVLQGAEKALRSPRLRSILVEVIEHISTTPQVVQLLESHGFSLQERNHHAGPDDVANYIFVRGQVDRP